MSLDTTIALVTLAEVKEHMNISTDVNDRDSFIETLINAHSESIVNYCQRKFIQVTTAINEIFNGDGESDYYVKNWPITEAITTLYYRNVGDTTWTLLSSNYEFEQDNDSGLIRFTDGNVFWRGIRNWKIPYKYGYPIGDVPASLKLACIDLVTRKYKQYDERLHGVTGKSFGDQSISYSLDNLPADIKATLNHYRRVF
jgi:hypothetical protein